ncbi:lumenal Hsp70 protein [Coniosporium tulheliwenetii]|uniref:Lumenal Hsp70 protein n=1 Tax=Coniosporium tulheliwenetii TaxID=3383036 RepID=A0ACC2YSK2_9PEZI|nr:lumenal Hsp70 protein [Cladosporium sp. JES 115]
MAPPGRRRTLPLLPTLTLLILLLTSTASAASAVLGIDLGTSYLKAALVKPGIPLEIVLSKDSKRKEAAAVAFKPTSRSASASGSFPERVYGGDALALAARFPGDVYPNLKPLLGALAAGSESAEVVGEYRRRHPALALEGVEGGSQSFGAGEPPFLVEELLAMELKNVRENAQAMAGKSYQISNAVITVPAFWTADERRAVQIAADLAGLNVMGLVSDGLAVGIHYATSRTFPSVSEGGKPEYHLVFDMGAGSTTATVLRFQGRTVKDVGKFNKTIQEVTVLGTGWDRTLGGDSLNGLIMDHMVEQFVATSGAKSVGVTAEAVSAHGRTAAKLWKEAERIRQVLSANQDTSSSFEGLYDDVDFRYKLSRTAFEEMAADFAGRVEAPIKQALDAAKLTVNDLTSLILHGGAVRTPFVQRKLEAMAGDASKLRSNVNADEAAVFGAAFRGAGLSPSFRVKEIRDVDAANYAVTMQWTENSKGRSQKLFTPTSQVGAVKQIPSKMTSDFEFKLSQQIPSGGDGSAYTEKAVLSVKTSNLTKSIASLIDEHGCAKEDIKNTFSIQLSPVDGLPEVTKATVSCEVTEGEKRGGVVDDVKGFFGFGSKKDGQEPLKDNEPPAPEAADPEPSSAASSASSSTAEPQPSGSAMKKDEKPATPKKKTVIINVGVTQTPEGIEGLSQSELKRIKDRLAAFDKSDANRRLREEALNTLEAYTYRARDIVSGEGFIAASTQEVRDKIQQQLSDVSEWLYGGGASAPQETLKARLDDLKALIEPVQKRMDEARKRPEQIKLLREALDQTNTMVGMVKGSMEKAAEMAKSAAEEASKSATSVTSSIAEAVTGSSDPLAELEEETDAPSSTTSAGKPSSTPHVFEYTQEDLSALEKAYTSINDWLTTKLEAQSKLSETDDPAMLSTDLEAKAKQLNNVVMDLLQRKLKAPPKPKKSKASKPKAKKASATKKADKAAKETERAEGEPITVKLGEDGSIPDVEDILRQVKEEEAAKKEHDEL